MSELLPWLFSSRPPPALDRLALALLHFVWEGLLVALLVAAVVHSLQIPRGRGRYAVYLVGMLVMAAAPVLNLALVSTPARVRLSGPVQEHHKIEPLDQLDLARTDALPPMQISLTDRARRRLDDLLPWISAAWLV